MHHSRHILSAFVILSVITLTPTLASAEDYTKKWARQRAEQQEMARQHEQQQLEKKRQREEQLKGIQSLFFGGDDEEGTDMDSEDEPQRVTVPDRTPLPSSGQTPPMGDMYECQGMLGTVKMTRECVGDAEYERYQRQIHGEDR